MKAATMMTLVLVVMVQNASVHGRSRRGTGQRSKDSTSLDSKPFLCPGDKPTAICAYLGEPVSVQLAVKIGAQYQCSNTPRKCCSNALTFDVHSEDQHDRRR
ncbi:hypothetical protein PTTG_26789 [Puccinia triticina 1-1 BBBD Race 1]|uniref:Hydrophobin n=1 Tax=Puccinia triticina (isolate 1-1 / race 1 (BBBD)) TaxID=630390 RepID=A0A180GQL1_PUCT1|nr:hypothetical protein PTTG_26789 [Puccinia triticina 1-1 BBBD Race 1]